MTTVSTEKAETGPGAPAPGGVPAPGGAARTIAIMSIACVCGWIMMEMEILGARVLAPYFGGQIYVWGSVIGVFLLSLAVGYMLGGWLSRLTISKAALGLSLAVSGAWLCAMPRMVQPLCDSLLNANWDEKWGSLVAALVLYGVPTALLGTVSPTVVRWLTHQARDAGLNTGLVLAVSTVASFAGCIVTSFYLVLLSVRGTIEVSGAVLAALGAVIFLHAVLTRTAAMRGER